MNRLETLKADAECVCGSREEDYGSPEDNFSVIAALWTAIWASEIEEFPIAVTQKRFCGENMIHYTRRLSDEDHT